MNFLKRCNGYSSGTPELKKETAEAVVSILTQARMAFREWADNEQKSGRDGDFYYGHRFNTDSKVLQRIQSAEGVSSEDVSNDPMAWALDALYDCASADHYYTFEKEWH
jgi:hypothetical protein